MYIVIEMYTPVYHNFLISTFKYSFKSFLCLFLKYINSFVLLSV